MIKGLGEYADNEIISILETAYKKLGIPTRIEADEHGRFYRSDHVIAWRSENGTGGKNLDLLDPGILSEMQKLAKEVEKEFRRRYPHDGAERN